MSKVNNKDKILLTKEGLDELKEELEKLVNDKRPALVKRLAQARSEGDLSENSNYIQSREELSFMDGRIEELEEVINRAVLVSKTGKCSDVQLGCKVTLKANKQNHIFHLVGEWEADPALAKISHQSPLGQALIGKKVGDKVEFKAPAGKVTYTVVKID